MWLVITGDFQKWLALLFTALNCSCHDSSSTIAVILEAPRISSCLQCLLQFGTLCAWSAQSFISWLYLKLWRSCPQHSPVFTSCVSLNFQADNFQRQGRNLRRKMWFQNFKVKLIVLAIIIIVILIIYLSICHGFVCSHSSSPAAPTIPWGVQYFLMFPIEHVLCHLDRSAWVHLQGVEDWVAFLEGCW